MHTKQSPRQSVALGSGREQFSEQQLQTHSYDLLLFPLYLQRNMAPRVRVEVVSDSKAAPDLMALYDDEGQEQTRFAFLRPDEAGVQTDSDALYAAVHAAFVAALPQARYLGFTRHGRPPVAPLFALALMYRRYGRGLYLDGATRPVPWPRLTAGYSMRC